MAASDSMMASDSGVNRQLHALQPAPTGDQSPAGRRLTAGAKARKQAPVEQAQPAADRERSDRRSLMLRFLTGPVAVSSILHIIVFLTLALVLIGQLPQERPLSITASVSEDDESMEEAEAIEIESLQVEEFEQPVLDALVDPGEIAIGDIALAGDVTAEMADLGAGGLVGDIGNLAGIDLGSGLGGKDDGTGGFAGTTFFGAKTAGNSFVFVVDNSISMGNGRFETALNELARAVDALGPKQQFYVIFFSDTAYMLFHPNPAPGLVPATDANKEKLRAWLYTVEMCLKTKGEQALRKALELQPDVISILGDGVFTDKTEPLLTSPHSRRTVINTFGMQVDGRGEQQLKSIAAANGGKFHAVDVDAAARQSSKVNPIRKNSTLGPIWGLELPPGK